MPWNPVGKVNGPNRSQEIYGRASGRKVIIPDDFRVRGHIAQIIAVVVLDASLPFNARAIRIFLVVAIVGERLREFFDLSAAKAGRSGINK